MDRFFCYRAFLLVVVLAAGVALDVRGQEERAVLTGAVVDADGAQPLVGVHVFIAASERGTTTDAEGRYRLTHVPLGAHRLVFSMVGFQSETRDVLLRAGGDYTFDATLTEDIINVGSITVEADRERRWKKKLSRFQDLLLGETPNAREVTLLNPEVLSIETRGQRLEAVAGAPLELENQALGYRITYFLKTFIAEGDMTRHDGEPLFEPLMPADDDEAERWRRARDKAFYGSSRHFLLSVLQGRAQDEGFVLYHVKEPSMAAASSSADPRFIIDPEAFLMPGETTQEYILRFDDFMEIIYTGEREDMAYRRWQGMPTRGRGGRQRSWIYLPQLEVILDTEGNVLNPYGVVYYGYMAYERLADLLPKEYRPM